MKTGSNLACTVCGTVIYIPPSRVAAFRYCTRACLAVARAVTMAGNRLAAGHSNATAFKPGHLPWNKDTKGLTGANRTSWTPGASYRYTPEMPLEALTVRTDKQGRPRNWIKTADGWRPYPQVLWERAFGPIPDGYLIHHIDWDSANDVPSNFELLTRAEHILVHPPKG